LENVWDYVKKRREGERRGRLRRIAYRADGRRLSRAKPTTFARETASRASARAALFSAPLRVNASVTCATYAAGRAIGGVGSMIVVVTVARRREKDTGDTIGAHEHVHAPLGFRKGWDTLSSRPVNSSFRSFFLPSSLSFSLFFFLVFFLSFARSLVRSFVRSFVRSLPRLFLPRPSLAPVLGIHASYFMRNGATPVPKLSWDVGLFPKGRSDLRSRVQHFSPHYTERRRVSKFEFEDVRFAIVVVKRIAINGDL